MPPKRHLSDGLQKQPVQTIARPATTDQEHQVVITDVRLVGSYNWVKTSQPTIIVPGAPSVWLDRQVPFTVKPDRGKTFIDQNGSRLPTTPLLPIFNAIDSMTPLAHIDWASVDFVTDRHNLRALLSWANGSNQKFRVDAQLAGQKTVLLNRWTERAKTSADPSSGSFGNNFEKAATRRIHGCENTSSHHRMILYRFGDMNMLVRYEADACLQPVRRNRTNQHPPIMTHSSRDGLTVIGGGISVQESSIIEIKTTHKPPSQAHNISWPTYYAQLHFSQTQHLFFATHQGGEFHTVTKANIRDASNAASAIGKKLSKLHDALKSIQEVVNNSGLEGRLSLVCQNGELNAVPRTDGASCLPEGVMDRFSGGSSGAVS